MSSASGYGASPAVAGGAVYAASDQGRLYALDGRTGQKIWTVKIDSEYSPAASGRMVYLGTRRGLQALDAATGKRLWTYRPWGQGVSSTPVVSHGMVYGRTAGWIAAVWAVDAQRGRDWWSLPADSPASSSPAVSGGVIYYTGNPLGGKYWLHAVDAQSGKDMWHSEAGSDEGISPAASSGVVCVTGFKTLYAVDARTGGERWQFETGGSISSSPAISNGVVYVGSDDGYLYAVGARPAVSYDESPEAGPYRHMLPSTGSVGWSFKPTVDIEVTELGCFSPERVGLKDAHRVGIFDAKTERLLASVTVRPQSTFEGFFRWEPLETPLVLKARHSYLVGTGTRGDETLYEEDLPSEQWAPEVAFGELLTSHGRSGGAFMAPTDPTYGANWDKIVWMSPNFKFVPVSVQPASTVLTD